MSAPPGWRCATGCCRTGSTTQLSTLDEAGQAELLAAELDGPTVTQLQRQKTPWSTTLDDDAQSIVEFGRKIGATERRRQGRERQFAELDADSASSSEARHAWIAVVKAVVGAMELAGLSEEQRERARLDNRGAPGGRFLRQSMAQRQYTNPRRHLGVRAGAGLIIAVLAGGQAAARTPLPPRPPDWIADAADILTTDEEAALADYARRVAEQRRVRLSVLTLASTGGEAPQTVAVRALNQWGAGTRSVLLLVVMQPRKLFLQPGTDLAPTFDEARSSTICHDVIAPQLRTGARGPALLAGFEAIVRQLAKDDILAPPSTPEAPEPSRAASRPAMASPRAPDPELPLWPLLALPLAGAGMGGVVWRLSGRYCERCRRRMRRHRETIEPATYSSVGRGRSSFACDCGNAFADYFSIPMLVAIASDSSSGGSWDSSSSSSDSSSSSSDSSGGGGSDW